MPNGTIIIQNYDFNSMINEIILKSVIIDTQCTFITQIIKLTPVKKIKFEKA